MADDIKTRWCQYCQRATGQQPESEGTRSGRLFWGAVTLGLSELIVERWWRCLRCGQKEKR